MAIWLFQILIVSTWVIVLKARDPGSNHGRLARWRKWRASDVREAKEGLENELWRRWSDGKLGEWAELIDIEIYSRVNSPTFPSLHLPHNSFSTLPSLYLRHSSLSNPSVASSTSQFILQPFFRFSYVTSSSLNSPGEPSMKKLCAMSFMIVQLMKLFSCFF